MNRQPAKNHVSPARQQRPQQQQQSQRHHTQPALDRSPVAVPVLSPKLNKKHRKQPSQSVQPAIPSTEAPVNVKTPRRRNRSTQQLSAPSTPTLKQQSPAAPVTPALPLNRRQPRSAKTSALSQAVEDGLPEWDSPPKDSPLTRGTSPSPSPAARRIRRSAAPAQIPLPSSVLEMNKPIRPVNWQQAALLTPSSPTIPTNGHPALGPRTAPVDGTSSTPSSPARQHTAPVRAPISRASSAPISISQPFPQRASAHTRAPSYPTFPMHREKDMFTTLNGENPLEALFNLSLNHSSHKSADLTAGMRSASARSLGSLSIHARMADQRDETERKRKAAFGSFAGASFQSAPNAISAQMPAIFGRLSGGADTPSTSSDEEADEDLSFDVDVVDLGEGNEVHKSGFPAFLL